MRSEPEYLFDILDAVDSIRQFVTGKSEQDFIADDLVRSAVLQKLMIIGEAVAKLSDGLKDKYPEVPWVQIKGFRNVVIHTYFRVSWQIVWNAAVVDAPALARAVSQVLATEFPNARPENS